MKHVKLNVEGMHCGGCESIIENALASLDGIEQVSADYPTGSVDVRFDNDKTDLAEIQKTIEESGYSVVSQEQISDIPEQPRTRPMWLKLLFALIAVMATVAIMIAARKLSHQFTLPDLNSHLSDSMIFLIGLITGLHCIGMCGGFVLSYTARDAENGHSSWLSHLLYGIGKTFSYAMFGALFGLLGSMISITPFIQGITNLVAGGFLILFGMNMLDIFAALKHVRIKQPKSMAQFAIEQRKRSRSPFLIGFFSGFLLGCGPLQAMYVMAAGSSDPLLGAKILTLFGLGTLPALLGFGYITRLFSAAATHRFFQLSGAILIFVGLMMFNKGLMRTHSGYDFKSLQQKVMSQLKQ